jgi:hypothetical protein
MKYDPENELTETELNELGKANFDAFLAYLDEKAAYLKQFTRPLESYHTKRFVAVSAAMQGTHATSEQLEAAKKIGRENFNKRMETESKASEKLGGDPKYKDPGIKNFKTHRSQWFD